MTVKTTKATQTVSAVESDHITQMKKEWRFMDALIVVMVYSIPASIAWSLITSH